MATRSFSHLLMNVPLTWGEGSHKWSLFFLSINLGRFMILLSQLNANKLGISHFLILEHVCHLVKNFFLVCMVTLLRPRNIQASQVVL